MTKELKMSSLQDATQVLDYATAYDKPIDIVFPNKKSAITFRYRAYDARKRLKKQLAISHGVTEAEVGTQYDRLHMSIVKLDESDDYDPRHAVRITPVDMINLEIRDTETGEQLEMFPDFQEAPAELHTHTPEPDGDYNADDIDDLGIGDD